MLRFEDIKSGQLLTGIEQGKCCEVIALIPVGASSATLYYKNGESPDTRERLLTREDEKTISIAETGRPWSFDAPADDFKRAAEACRISLAYLFDPMMAVHTSNVEPLPHQITAVYESMLPRQPLRFVLADDPGAGKTVMAGLFIRELLMRADARRILIVAPGSLGEQWHEEMSSKFGLQFELFTRQMLDLSHSGNPFDDYDLLIARLDQLARAEDLQEKLALSSWDLVIVDEAHKMSASFFGNKINETRRFKLGKLLSRQTRHFLLMTATPHNGKEEDFQLFLSLLDAERFYGKFREGTTAKVDVSDIMRRMVKEDLLKFDNTRLFPERRAYALNYRLSEPEQALYEAVTRYVREEMGKADQLQAGHRGRVGFALTGLQRRLASSPEAIFQTLRRRRQRLERRLEELRHSARAGAAEPHNPDLPDDAWELEDALNASEFEQEEEKLVDQATASRTAVELHAEITVLHALEDQAREVARSGTDRKWEELSRLLQQNDLMRDGDGIQRKLIIFTEYRDTLNYLAARITNLLGSDEAVVVIHGGVNREERRHVQSLFRNDGQVRVLIATDAAGEGVNLQNANLMVNYDLPWNPNRLEQRFGRIHRIGQLQICHLWNLIAGGTREGDVFQRLFEKLEVERKALGGRVFDILGEVFEEKSLRDLLIEAIRYGEQPEKMAWLRQKVEGALDTARLRDILDRNALCTEIMSPERLFAVKEEMDRAEARKLQPHYMRAFFLNAFQHLHGTIHPREEKRYEITRVPELLRARGDALRRKNSRILPRYQRICFEKEQIQLAARPAAPMAELMHPGHPLLKAVLDEVLDTGRALLRQGCILLDPADDGQTPRVLLFLRHTIREEKNASVIVSQRIQFVEMLPDGETRDAGWAPYLSCAPFPEADRPLVADILNAPWISRDLEKRAVAYASDNLAPQHFAEVSRRRAAQADKIRDAVRVRLAREADYQQNNLQRYEEKAQQGRDMRLKIDQTRKILEDLQSRRLLREAELDAMKHVVSSSPVAFGGALIIPRGLLAARKPGMAPQSPPVDAAARARVEQLAMQAVIEAEQARGCTCIDVSDQNCGWDITSIPPRAADGSTPPDRHIEVKGRAAGQTTVTVSHNEICAALNQQDKFWLALVFVDGTAIDGPHYIHRPFTREPDMAAASVNYDIRDLLRQETRP